MLNSAEHEICHANKSQTYLQLQDSFLLNIAENESFSTNKYEMPTIVEHFHNY